MSRHALFEVSFEVCNKIGGIYTVLSTKALTLVGRFGDDYVCVGPWLLRDDEKNPVPFERERGFEEFEEACRAAGLPVQVGRWTIPGRPRTVLVEFSSLYDKKNDILAGLWEQFNVDSLQGDWDYLEPLLFGHAAGQVIERWWDEFHAPAYKRAVAQFHEWMTGSGLLHLKRSCPGIGTVFTTHATMLGRALSSLGRSPADGLGNDKVVDLAREHGVVAKHSMEGVCAREADVFTTVSTITADEAALLHERVPEPVLPNGIDLEVIDAIAGATGRAETRARLERLASSFVGEDVSDAVLVGISGRYEFHNKGLDLLLDALADLEARPAADGHRGRRLVLFVLVPAGNSGLRAEVREREGRPPAADATPIGISTHNLFDPARDPVQQRCAALGLDNRRGSRVKVIQVPIYLSPHDDLLQLPYEAVVRALDLTCFPSYYEPWGYTPQESLALGVPTITTDYAGFGRWAAGEGLGVQDGVEVLHRERVNYGDVRAALAHALERFLGEFPPPAGMAETCRATARRTSWSDLIAHYHAAFHAALECVQRRLEQGLPLRRRPKRVLPVTGESHAPRLTRFDVAATLPEPLAPLGHIAQSYAWCWDPEAPGLFEELSPAAWEAAGHNPVVFLRQAFPQDLERRAADPAYVERLRRVDERLRARQAPGAGGAGIDPRLISRERPVAYFSAEFGVHESLRIYSGGLGVLAGDYLKAASDMGLPVVGVGLFYRMGYMTQRLTAEGDQYEVDLENLPADLPIEQVRDERGELLEVRLKLPSRELCLRAWHVHVGSTELYLLDANVPANMEEDRGITHNLYGGDETVRIRQEIVLGRGGARLLQRLGIQPAVWHMNEGHAAFLALERVARLVREEGLTFEEAREVVRSSIAFTTHTPVPAGHDRFSEDLMRTYFADVADWLGVPWERFLALGRAESGQRDFNMTTLAIHFAAYVNGVSQIHGRVSRELLHTHWPGLLTSEVPVGSVTNGVHLGTWVRPAIARLVGAGDRPVRGEDFAERAKGIDLAALDAACREAKGILVERLRTRFEHAFFERRDNPALLGRVLDGLDERALWIGFARRFAPYKRARLMLEDQERLRALLGDAERPVRLVVAGKAHPRDGQGKEILRDLVRLSRSAEFAGRLFVVEGYDIDLARTLVQGVDVWLNTPTRRLEASGTSGMKAAANGALNVSIADGWWPEGADELNGWTIGGERTYEDQKLQDQLDSQTLYTLLEDEVVPLFFERDESGIPQRWLERSRHALATLPPVFNTERMLRDYASSAYLELAREGAALAANRSEGARTRARAKARLRELFPKIRVTEVRVSDLASVRVGDSIEVRLVLDLAQLTPSEVAVELVLGHAKPGAAAPDLVGGIVEPLRCVSSGPGQTHAYEGGHKVERSGAFAYGLRVRASADLGDLIDTLRDLVRWVG